MTDLSANFPMFLFSADVPATDPLFPTIITNKLSDMRNTLCRTQIYALVFWVNEIKNFFKKPLKSFS